MKIVIDIPEENYLNLIKTDENGEKEIPLGLLMSLWDNVKYNCTPLPKNHGRLIDADKTIQKICGSSCGCHLEECGHEKHCFSVTRIESAHTIIEADKEKESEEE